MELAELHATEKLGDGGQGTVYRLADGRLLKLYHPGIAVLPDELARLIDLPDGRGDLSGAPFAWPSGRVFDGGRCVGLLMPEAPARFATSMAGRRHLLELRFLLYPRRATWADLELPTGTQRRRLAVAYVRLFRTLHRNGVVAGDVSMRDLLWSLRGGPSVFAIDCDGFRVAGRPCAVRPADPVRPRAVTLDADRYRLALVTLRVLVGDHSITPEDVCRKEFLRRLLGRDLSALAGYAARPGRRPAAECWLAALGQT